MSVCLSVCLSVYVSLYIGSVKLCHPFWCCERLEVMDANGLETVETFPVTKGSFNFCNSAGLAYQANEVSWSFLSGCLGPLLGGIKNSMELHVSYWNGQAVHSSTKQVL